MRLALALSLLALHPALALADPAGAPVQVARGDHLAPRFSPDGSALLVTGPRWQGLAELDLATGETRAVTDEPRAGLTGRYLADGRIAFEARRAGRQLTVALAADGREASVEPPPAVAFAHGDRIYVRSADGIIAIGTGDRFFSPAISPDGTRVAFLGLATGVWVYDVATGALEHLGPGTAPAWAPDSRALAFERTEDDGHEIVGSDIWLWRAGSAPAPLMATDRVVERRPSWAPDGRTIAFDDDRGAVFLVTVEERP